MAENDKVTISLSLSEALVLFEWSYRFAETKNLRFDHPSEPIVVDRVAALLEEQLPVVFQEEYPELLRSASEEVVEGYRHRMGKHSQWLDDFKYKAVEPLP